MRWLVMLVVVACGNTYEPIPETPDEQDETMVITFEEMARFARGNPTCVEWATETGRRWGARRLQVMTQRIAAFDEARKQAFQTKYGARIQPAAEVVIPFSERCLEEARTRPLESIKIQPR